MTAAVQPRPRTLTAAQAKALHIADVDVSRARATLEAAERRQREVRARYRDLVPLSDDPKERRAGVRAVTVGGFDVRVAPVAGG